VTVSKRINQGSANSYGSLKVTLMAKIEELEKEMEARDNYVQQLENDIEERDDYVQQLWKEMEDRDNHIQRLLDLNKDLKKVNEDRAAHQDAEGRKQEQTRKRAVTI
jgi:peptidoglycan hydrolase CwlO-like protein